MARAPIFTTGRASVSNAPTPTMRAYKNYKDNIVRSKHKRNKMSIRERIASWIYPAAFKEYDDDCIREADTPRGDPTLSFKIYNTNDGNKIVEFYSYDTKTDRSNSDLYIITADEDYGQALARIAMLKKLSS